MTRSVLKHSDFLLIHVHTEMVSVPWTVIGFRSVERNSPVGTRCPSSLYSLPGLQAHPSAAWDCHLVSDEANTGIE